MQDSSLETTSVSGASWVKIMIYFNLTVRRIWVFMLWFDTLEGNSFVYHWYVYVYLELEEIVHCVLFSKPMWVNCDIVLEMFRIMIENKKRLDMTLWKFCLKSSITSVVVVNIFTALILILQLRFSQASSQLSDVVFVVH